MTKLELTKLEQFHDLKARYESETERFENELTETVRKVTILKGELNIRIGNLEPTEDVEEEIRKLEAKADDLKNRIEIMPNVKADKMTSMVREVEAEVRADHDAIKPEFDAQHVKVNEKRAELLAEIAKLYEIDARAKQTFRGLIDAQSMAGIKQTYERGSYMDSFYEHDEWTKSNKEKFSQLSVTVPYWMVEDYLKGNIPEVIKAHMK